MKPPSFGNLPLPDVNELMNTKTIPAAKDSNKEKLRQRIKAAKEKRSGKK